MKPPQPRIPWKAIWKEFDECCKRDDAERTEQQRLIGLIIQGHIDPWTVAWVMVWKTFDKYLRGDVRADWWWWERRKFLQRLVHKHLQGPKK